MRITGLSIDGFGVFCGREIRDLSPGLTVLYGPNEAGKSTLLAFIRGALFGFPRPAKNRRAFYPPLAGGRHGGRIFLETAGGAVTIDREVKHPPRIALRDAGGIAAELSDVEFQQLIGGVDAQTFRTVFAFSLDELRDFESLTGEQIRARIFAAGVGGAGPSVRQVIQDLERTCGQLLKPRSQEGEINRILSQVISAERSLIDARAMAESYPALLEEKRSVQDRLSVLDIREQELRADQALHQRLLELWPLWVDLEANRRELDVLEPVDTFVPDAVRRLTEGKEGLDGAGRSLARLEAQRAQRLDEAAQLQAGMFDALWALTPSIEQQVDSLPRYQDRLREREAVRRRAALLDDRLDQALREVGAAEAGDTVMKIDTSLPRLEEIRSRRAGLADAQSHTRQAAEQVDSAFSQRARIEAERDRERAALEALPRADAEAHALQTAALRELRAGTADLRAKQALLDGRLSASAALADAVPSARDGRAPSARLVIAVIALAVVLVVAAVAAAAAGSMVAGALMGVFAVLAVTAATALMVLRALGRAATRGAAAASADPRDDEERRQEALRVEIGRLRSELAGPAAALGLADLGDPRQLEVIDASLAAQHDQIARWKQQSAALQRADERSKDARLEESLAGERLARAKQEQAALEASFKGMLADWGLPDGLSAEGIEEYLRGVAAIKDLAARCAEEQATADRLEADIGAWETETRRLVGLARAAFAERMGVRPEVAADGESEDPSTLEATLLGLASACREETDLRLRASELAKSLRELDDEMERLGKEIVDLSRGWDALMTEAGASDEAEFLRKLSVYDKRQELKRALTQGEDTLVKAIGRGSQAEAFRELLAAGEVVAWEGCLQHAHEAIEELGIERAGLNKGEGDIERRLRDIEQSGDVAAVETDLEGLKTELDSAMERWRTNSLASLLVRETLAQFTQERQPLVLAEASRMFQCLTLGRYIRVQRSTDEEGLVVLDADGRVKSPDELSRGAAEQLYLCLRLGLAEEFARRAEPMPLVMDDVLVNFDAARRRTTAELLLEFAGGHQVLLFTCHEEITQLIHDLDASVGTIELS